MTDIEATADHLGINPIILEMETQSDRGCAICGGALLEEQLQGSIEKQWPPISSTLRDALFKGARPLATFSAKIDLASAMGLILDDVRADLHAVKHIRNEAAHLGTPFSFSDGKSHKYILSLRAPKRFGSQHETTHGPDRSAFIDTVKCVSAQLYLNVLGLKRFGRAVF